MKLKYYTQFLFICLLISSIFSCEKWVEVSPRTAIEDINFFSNESGFKEALNGVYLQMGNPSQYGRELTFGLVDVLGGMYVLNSSNGSLAYRDAFAGNYANSATKAIINNVWSSQYNSIANLNKLIEELEKADPNLFADNNYQVIKGEALGLRAFLHFDLLRLFGKSYLDGGSDVAAIPYVTGYTMTVTGMSKSSEVITKIMADLTLAEQLLKDADPIITNDDVTNNNYLQNRKLRFNYYAVRALQARAYLWEGNTTEALTAAEDVIAVAASKFPWILQANIATSTETAKDRVFSTEHIFGLYANKLEANYVNLLDASNTQNMLSINTARITLQFESIGASDYRNVYLIRLNVPTPNGAKTFFGKLYQPVGIQEAFAKRMPLIRIPEMYYIAAECLKAVDPGKSVQYLNTVRGNRGITTLLSTSLTSDQIQNEIMKEYWKEFPCEGQMWYYYKRLNGTAIPGITGTYPSARYVLPLPEDEIEFRL